MLTQTQRNYADSFAGMIGQIQRSAEPDSSRLKDAAFENGVCFNCGESLISETDNVGFSDNPHNEIHYRCPNGCELD